MLEYSNRQNPRDPSFWRLCDTQTNECHCDFRMTITDCIESEALRIVNIVDIAWSGVATIIAAAILYWRVVHRNQQIFDFSLRFPRPKPIEAMALFGVLFNVCRIIHASVLLTDVANNAIFRSFMFELPWQFGITALSCYLFGVANTLSHSSKTIYKTWVGSQTLVDIICTSMITLPYITINIVAIIAGVHAQRGDTDRAEVWTGAIYYLWLVYTFLLGSLILFAGIRLLKLLNNHLLMQTDLRVNIAKIRTGAVKVKIIIGIGCFCLWAFTVMIALYATSRYTVMISPVYTTALASFALFNGPLATSVVEFALVLNPHMLRGLGSLSFGSSGGSQSSPSAIALESQQQQQQKQDQKEGVSSEGSKFEINTLTTSSQLEQWNQFFIKDIKNSVNSNGGTVPSDIQRSNSKHSVTGDRTSNTIGYSLSSYPTSPKAANITIPSSSYHRMSPYAGNDASSNGVYHVEEDTQTLSRVEEDQLYYNAMTNQMRMPPHYSTSDDRRFDTNDSLSSDIYDGSSVSAIHLMQSNSKKRH
ncbi:hypothetical protein [Absidia glauca]|uniref:Uncharacterized protein n=1 Tax=Absidia glauca TaxID=4829 RepID=A0A163LYP0_ABSGL|nr:hypothetical protein [Absidia glauca]